MYLVPSTLFDTGLASSSSGPPELGGVSGLMASLRQLVTLPLKAPQLFEAYRCGERGVGREFRDEKHQTVLRSCRDCFLICCTALPTSGFVLLGVSCCGDRPDLVGSVKICPSAVASVRPIFDILFKPIHTLGKTVLARAAAVDSGATLFLLNGPDVMSEYFGASIRQDDGCQDLLLPFAMLGTLPSVR